jgi:predicted nucleic acid-binding protein
VIAYIDTSALLRIVLREAGALEDLRSYEALVSSELIAVESARTIDRLRIQGSLTTEEAVKRIRVVNEWLEAIDLVLLPEMATHETALGAAARTFGFNVRGT